MRPRGIQGVHLGRAWKAPPLVRILFLALAMTWLATTCVLFVRHHGLDFVSLSLLTPPDTYILSSSSSNTTSPFCSKSFVWPSLDDPLTAEKSALAPLRCSIPSATSTTNKNEEELIDMRQLVAELPFDNPDGGAWKQGWDVEPIPVDEQHPLQIFVVPHSHCDPGWIKTFDDYFQSQTRQILTTVYKALMADDRRRFIWAEISYFEWWYREQDLMVQTNTQMLIQSKRLEFVTGGWVQPDEANTDIFAIEVQLQEGHDWIRSTFGSSAVPVYHWSIDPFGYSPTMAAILHKYQFKGMLIQRVHYAVKKELAKRKHLEFHWRQTWDSTGEHDMFAHVMPFYSYDVPHTCGPDPSVCCQFDFARIHKFGGCPWGHKPQPIDDHNVAERAQLILDQWKKKANLYRSRVVLIPLGDDFRYQDSKEAEAQYTNFQKIFDYLNQKVPGVHAQFGTLSNYFEAARASFATPVPVLKGSFFTYSDRNEDYWSGYFTSRVFDKALGRRLERSLYAASMLGATKQELQGPRRSLSLFQHHDGVTGTAKSTVVQDYALKLQTSIIMAQNWMAARVGSIQKTPMANLVSCYQSSSSPRSIYTFQCDTSKPLFAFNPLSQEQYCGDVAIPGLSTLQIKEYPCDSPGKMAMGSSLIRFGSNGMMTHPIQEEWNVWQVEEGGAYLFFPNKRVPYSLENAVVEKNGYMVKTAHWSRNVTERRISGYYGKNVTVLDFEYETNLVFDNQEWFVRMKAPINDKGIFHTDLNGFNFDTHYFRKDLPIQSQVFPMPTLASIEDSTYRLTVLSEHAQGTAHLENGAIDIWLDRRLRQDDNRGLFEGVTDNVVTRTKLRIILETDGWEKGTNNEFEITSLCKRMWDDLNHPLEIFGSM